MDPLVLFLLFPLLVILINVAIFYLPVVLSYINLRRTRRGKKPYGRKTRSPEKVLFSLLEGHAYVIGGISI